MKEIHQAPEKANAQLEVQKREDQPARKMIIEEEQEKNRKNSFSIFLPF